MRCFTDGSSHRANIIMDRVAVACKGLHRTPGAVSDASNCLLVAHVLPFRWQTKESGAPKVACPWFHQEFSDLPPKACGEDNAKLRCVSC